VPKYIEDVQERLLPAVECTWG